MREEREETQKSFAELSGGYIRTGGRIEGGVKTYLKEPFQFKCQRLSQHIAGSNNPWEANVNRWSLKGNQVSKISTN